MKPIFTTTRLAPFICALLLFSSTLAQAEDSSLSNIPDPAMWSLTATPQYTYGSYDSAATRESMSSAGFLLDLQYLEQGGITLGVTSTDLKMKPVAPASISSTIKQTTFYVSGQLNLTPDFLPGQLNLSGNVLRAENNDASNETNGVNAVTPKISFLNFNKNFYTDLAYSYSHYGASNIGNGSLSVQQFSATAGLGFNQGSEWLQLRGFDITPSNANRAMGYKHTQAVEAKWIHYFSPTGVLENVQLATLYGRRIYTVDGSSLYNLSDAQRGGTSLATQWKLAPDISLLVQVGQDQYLTTGNIIYNSSYFYAGLSNRW